MDFLRWVWGYSLDAASGWVVLKYRTLEGKWFNHWFSPTEQEAGYVYDFPENCDIYFSPVVYSRTRAKKEFTLPSCWLFADLDYADPTELPFVPTVVWETSEGKWQALWLMEMGVEREEHRILNRAMCFACGADAGTWNINRLLRVPGTENMKARRRG